MRFSIIVACLVSFFGLNSSIEAQDLDVVIGYGSTVYCEGDTTTFVNLSTGAESVSWTVNEVDYGNGDEIQVVFDSAVAWVISLTGYAEGNEDADEIVIQVNPLPEPNINPSQDVDLCEGSSIQMYFSEAYASYSWSTGDDVETIFAGETAEYWCVVTDFVGCSASSDTISVAINPDPDPTLEWTGSLTICEGDTLVVSTQEYEEYDWNTGQTTQSINVTQPGFLAVTVTNEYGCSSQSNLIQVEVLDAPVPGGISAEGGLVYCPEDSISVILYADSSWTDILWNSGDTTLAYTATESGSYWYSVLGENGCWGNSDSLTIITAEPISVALDNYVEYCPTISQMGMAEITVSGGTPPFTFLWSGPLGFEWPEEDLIADLPGNFSLVITDTVGCEEQFEIEIETCTNVNEIEFLDVLISPNPTGGIVRIDGNTVLRDLVVFDSDGRLVFNDQKPLNTLDLSFLNSGVYTLLVEMNGEWGRARVVIER